jgi:hypothetical protein
MFRALPAVVFALFPATLLAQQTPPQVPDTRPARERHRLEEKAPPPTYGPWGPEEVGFTWNTPAWRGLFFEVGHYAGGSIDLKVPLALATFSDGLNPPIFEQLQYHSESFQATSFGGTADFDMFRLSAAWFDGGFRASATLSYDDGLHPPTSRELSLEGNLYGFRAGIHWPGLRYRDSLFEASAGLIATVGWMHQETFIPGVYLKRDAVDILTGSIGPKGSLRLYLGRFALDANAEYSFTTGAARGWVREFTVGIGYSF